MLCKNCGKEIQDTVKFCTYCGKPIIDANEDTDMQYKGQKKSSYFESPNRKLLLACVCIALLCVFTIVWYFGDKKGANNSVNITTEKISEELLKYTKAYRIISDQKLTTKEVQNVATKLQKKAENITAEAVVQMRQNGDEWDIEVTLPGIDDDSVFQAVTSEDTLEFVVNYGAEEAETIVTNKNISSAYADDRANIYGEKEFVVIIELDEKGSELMAIGTEKYVGEPLCIVFNETSIDKPVIMNAITDGKVQIITNTQEEAELMASILNVGSLDIKLEETQVLGQ